MGTGGTASVPTPQSVARGAREGERLPDSAQLAAAPDKKTYEQFGIELDDVTTEKEIRRKMIHYGCE